MKLKMLVALFFVGSFSVAAQKSYTLQSPDKKLQAVVTIGEDLRLSVSHEGTEVLAPSTIALTLQDGTVLGCNPKVSKVSNSSVNQTIPAPLYKKAQVEDRYNETTFSFMQNYGLVVRLYNEGMAYRFTTSMKDEIVIANETADYCFSKDYTAFAPYANSSAKTFSQQAMCSFENTYVNDPITKLDSQRLMFLPLLVNLDGGKKLCITEADLEDYPGMFLNNSATNPELKGYFAAYPKVKKQAGHNNLQMIVEERENYIAKTKGTRAFPWRVFIVSTEDKDLANCDMVYRLASPNRLSDVSWVKPGKVAWDWWNDWNIYGVDFRAGINNDTYKYYIDFASEKGIEYVILDEGWAVNLEADLMKVIPEINIKELVDYGKAKNVGIILWAGYHAFDRDMENVVKYYADMGVKGFKVDFMDRDDQEIINFLYRGAETCARYKMMVDYHGICKPTGLQRTYPNVINYEGVHGLENVKWSLPTLDMPRFDVTVPFIRMIAGPMDYTQGAMRNGAKGCYAPINSDPISQGTRCHQLAAYVIFESPFNMLCDNPSNYRREPECTAFIAAIPTVWEETVALDGKVGEYIATARRDQGGWYVGAMTNWDARDMELDLSFLGEGSYKMEIFQDGINADRAACDYKKVVVPVPADRKVKLHMAPGGGWAARITK